MKYILGFILGESKIITKIFHRFVNYRTNKWLLCHCDGKLEKQPGMLKT